MKEQGRGQLFKMLFWQHEEKGPEKGRFWRINGNCAEAGCYK